MSHVETGTFAQPEDSPRLEHIAAQVPGVVYQYRLFPNGSSCFSYASEGIRDIYRVSPEEVREDATPVLRLLHPEDADRVWASIQASASTFKDWQCQYRVLHRNGDLRWLLGQAHPERQADGSTCWHGFISDITERVATERLRVCRSCPLITPKDARSWLQMRAIARAMAVLCAWTGRLLTRCSITLEKLSASEAATHDVRVVAVTAQAMPGKLDRMARVSFDGVLAKPLNLASFDAMLERLMHADPGAPA